MARSTRLILAMFLVCTGMVSYSPPAEAVDSYFSTLVKYDKNACNWECSTDPLLTYTYGSVTNGIPYCCYTKSWRAGSGTGQDACTEDVGWIPNTVIASGADNQYHLAHHEGNGGSIVKGTRWLITNTLYGGTPTTAPSLANCNDGDDESNRSELLIHSEMTDSHGADCEPWCWDGPIDYQSAGCIKVSFVDTHNYLNHVFGVTPSFDWYWHNRGGIQGEDLVVVNQP